VSSAVLEPNVSAEPNHTLAARGWLVGPWFDALLIANVAWPLFLLAQVGDGFSGRAGLQFWQVYFVTTPHRWITLALVFLDRERFGQRRWTFLGLAACAIALCLGVRLTTGTLTCLLTIDYIWNAWHFAAQHHGIYRIYGRRCDPDRTRGLFVEKWAMRLFLLYVILRVALATWPYPTVERFLGWFDWLALAVPAWLLVQDIARGQALWSGQMVYLLSVCGLYVSMLTAVHLQLPALALALTLASALFHAIEYLSLVGWSVQQRHAAAGDRMGLLGYLAPRWAMALGVSVLILGSGGWMLDQHFLRPWLTVNIVVAFLHYAYDGLIWRQRAARAP
jgi:hypothetical protein